MLRPSEFTEMPIFGNFHSQHTKYGHFSKFWGPENIFDLIFIISRYENRGLRGPGGSSTWRRSKSSFCCFWQRGVSATRCFLPDQKILFLAEVIKFWNPENMGNYSMRANFKRVFPKMDIFGISKSIFSYIFWDKCLKLRSYVLGTKTKLSRDPNVDLGLSSVNIEFLNCQ